MTDISKEAVERHIQRCWLTDPEPDRTEAMLRALSARVEAVTSDRQYIVGHCEGYELGRKKALEEALSIYRQRRMNVGANASFDAEWKIAHDELMSAEKAIQSLKEQQS